MGFLKIKLFERNEVHENTPKEIYNYRIYLAAIVSSFAAVIIGYDAGFIGGTVALTSFMNEFGYSAMTSAEQTLIDANIVSVFQAGAYFGSFFIYPIGQKLGRRVGLIISGFFLVVGAGISLASKSSVGLGPIYAGRVISGLGVGGCSSLAPIYVSEIAPPSIRGQLVGMYEIAWQVGGVVGYWINYGVSTTMATSRSQWLIPFAVQLVPSGVFFIGLFFIPESPRWLYSEHKDAKARSNLAFLRNLPVDHEYIKYEVNNIERSLEEHEAKIGRGFWAPFKYVFTSKQVMYRLLLSTSLFPMQNGSGINAVTYYSPTVFKSLGISGTNTSLLSTGIFGIIKALSSLFWLFFIVDAVGRRASLMYGSIPCCICMWYIGAYIKVSDPAARLAAGDTEMNSAGKGALAMFYIWAFAFGISWNGNVWVYNSEIFDQSIRTLTQAINASSNWFFAFIMGRFTGKMFTAMGYGVYFLFAGMMAVSPIVVFLFYPETKGIPLEGIDYLFEKGVPAWKARDYALGMIRSEDEEIAYAEKADVETVENLAAAETKEQMR
ncbi:general substrate transporter [Limtongia smithiae]|uniref:general substrate transporter n=1 Tax=Limtongia smithiae TaxID=1125753 RepID=UPI0034CF465F